MDYTTAEHHDEALLKKPPSTISTSALGPPYDDLLTPRSKLADSLDLSLDTNIGIRGISGRHYNSMSIGTSYTDWSATTMPQMNSESFEMPSTIQEQDDIVIAAESFNHCFNVGSVSPSQFDAEKGNFPPYSQLMAPWETHRSTILDDVPMPFAFNSFIAPSSRAYSHSSSQHSPCNTFTRNNSISSILESPASITFSLPTSFTTDSERKSSELIDTKIMEDAGSYFATSLFPSLEDQAYSFSPPSLGIPIDRTTPFAELDRPSMQQQSGDDDRQSRSVLAQRRNAVTDHCEKTTQAIEAAMHSKGGKLLHNKRHQHAKRPRMAMFSQYHKNTFSNDAMSPKTTSLPSQGEEREQEKVLEDPVQGPNDIFEMLSQWDFACTRSFDRQSQSTRGKTRKETGVVANVYKARRKEVLASRRQSVSARLKKLEKMEWEASVAAVDSNEEGGEEEEEDEEEEDKEAEEEEEKLIEVEADAEETGEASKFQNKNQTTFSISHHIILRHFDTATGADVEIPYPEDNESYERALRAKKPPVPAAQDSSQEGENNKVKERATTSKGLDLYTPRWSRGGYRERHGWCHLCEKGGWYSLKRSQYLYHLQYDHGISSMTKRVFEAPKALRIWNDAVKSVEGRCRQCDLWIPISFGPNRKRSFKVWFKHVHSCDSNQMKLAAV
ncbi:hypothetical protein CBS101457_002437 [Exobasidium rhododendri]|nr:hypothetical protein CBS101457_002437 [Exobasidium rhododendri]